MPQNQRIQLWHGIGIACSFTGNSEYATVMLCATEGFENNFWDGIKNGKRLLNSLSQLKKKRKL